MEKQSNENSVSTRLKSLVAERFPTRGRFGELETISGIGLNRWKNFYYGKQNATKEMVDFWCEKYPNDSDWLLTGIKHPDQRSFPFAARIPKRWEGQTIADRLNWVITEWASPTGEQLFSYLEEKSNRSIPAEEWAQVILRTKSPTAEMISVVADARPHFTEWIIRGHVSKMQVDPIDASSIDRWKKKQSEEWDQLRCKIEDTNDDQTS